MRKFLKYPLFLPSILIGSALLLRTILAVQGWTPTDSDEAIMNLAALHISRGRDFPVFFYGQHYLGALEAYIGALLFRVFGPSVLAMRLEMAGFYAAFLAVLYSLIRRLYTRNFALVVLALFVLGSPRMLTLQSQAVGYPELPLFAALLFLVAFVLAMSTEHTLRKKAVLYALWGFVAGLAMWVHVLTGPYILMAFSLMMLWQFKCMLKIGLWAILGGFVVGAFPLLRYNIHAAPGRDTLTNVLTMTQVGQAAVYDFWQHLLNTLFVSIPAASGLSSQCFTQDLAGSYPFLPTYHAHCLAEQAVWGLGFVALMIVAAGMAIVSLYRTRGNRDEMVKQSTSLLLLLSALLTLVLYIRGGAPVYMPFLGSRYLICMWVSVPVLLWPISRVRFADFASFALLFIILAHGTIMTFAQVSSAQAESTKMHTLASYLEEHHITRFYSGYWTCNRLIFYTQEKLICGNTDVTPHSRLVHGTDRYQPYRQIMLNTKAAAFVYPSTNITVGVAEYYLKKRGIGYTVDTIADCTIIVPKKATGNLVE